MKILIVEDEKILADSLKKLLEAKGFEAEAVYNGEDGKEYALLGIYDLLILDVMMPGMNGYQVARQVRANRCSTPHSDAHRPGRAGGQNRRTQCGSRLLSDKAL